jgi:hypothetical protein
MRMRIPAYIFDVVNQAAAAVAGSAGALPGLPVCADQVC